MSFNSYKVQIHAKIGFPLFYSTGFSSWDSISIHSVTSPFQMFFCLFGINTILSAHKLSLLQLLPFS